MDVGRSAICKIPFLSSSSKRAPIFGLKKISKRKRKRGAKRILIPIFLARGNRQLTSLHLLVRPLIFPYPRLISFLLPNRGNDRENQQGTGCSTCIHVYTLKNSPILYRIPIGPPRGAKNWRCFTRQEQKEKRKTRARCTLSRILGRIPQEIDRGKGVIYRRNRSGIAFSLSLSLFFSSPPLFCLPSRQNCKIRSSRNYHDYRYFARDIPAYVMQRVRARMHMHERVLLCSTTRHTRKIANAEPYLQNNAFGKRDSSLLPVIIIIIFLLHSQNYRRETNYQLSIEEFEKIFSPKIHQIIMNARLMPGSSYRLSFLRKQQQQQQQRGRLPFLWIFLPSLPPLSSLSLSLSLQHLSTSPLSFPLEGKVLEGSRKASWRVGNCAGWHTRSRKRLRR